MVQLYLEWASLDNWSWTVDQGLCLWFHGLITAKRLRTRGYIGGKRSLQSDGQTMCPTSHDLISPRRLASYCVCARAPVAQSSLRLENECLKEEDPWERTACGWQQAHSHLLLLSFDIVCLNVPRKHSLCFMLSAKWTLADGKNKKGCFILKPRQWKGPRPFLKLHSYYCLGNQPWYVRTSITWRTSSLMSSFKYF